MSFPNASSRTWDMGKADDHAGWTAKQHKKRRTFHQSLVTSLMLLSVVDAFFAHDVCEVTSSGLSKNQPRSSLALFAVISDAAKAFNGAQFWRFASMPVNSSSDVETRVYKKVIIFVICMLQEKLLQGRSVIMRYQLSYAIVEELLDGDSNNRILGIELSVCDEFQVLTHKTRCVELLVSEMYLWGLEQEIVTGDGWGLVAVSLHS
ncbi:hypothetical protein MY4824_005524 [Beauveria thailandica]